MWTWIPDPQLKFCLHLLLQRYSFIPSLVTAVISKRKVMIPISRTSYTAHYNVHGFTFVVYLHSTYNEKGVTTKTTKSIHSYTQQHYSDSYVAKMLCFSLHTHTDIHTHTHLIYLVHTFTGMDRYCTFRFVLFVARQLNTSEEHVKKIKSTLYVRMTFVNKQ